MAAKHPEEEKVALIDKPSGITSSELAVKVKVSADARKAGHTGTLDPRASGLMIILLDDAVKKAGVFEGLDKKYDAVMLLHRDAEKKEIEEAVLSFVGEIEQIPPRRSAVARKPRKRRIYSITINSIDRRRVNFSVRCEAGTYIRKLCHDMGKALGTGANMVSLRRTAIGPISVSEAVPLDEFLSSPRDYLKPLGSILKRMENLNNTKPL